MSAGSSASGRACTCANKSKKFWTIVGYAGKQKDIKVVYCSCCGAQWNTKAKYTSTLNKAYYLK